MIAALLCVTMIFSLSACGKKKEQKYQDYIKGLIAINYLGASESYLKDTGATKEDAQTLYNNNVELLADNLITYYGVVITDSTELRERYVELAKSIYGKVNYKVSEARKDGSVYLVDIEIYPINIFAQTSEEVKEYVNKFNTDVANGVYNDYELAAYETEFSDGLLEILNNGCNSMTYAKPVTVTVEIIEDGDTYYISDADMLEIDSAMISTAVLNTETVIPE